MKEKFCENVCEVAIESSGHMINENVNSLPCLVTVEKSRENVDRQEQVSLHEVTGEVKNGGRFFNDLFREKNRKETGKSRGFYQNCC